MIKTFVIDIDGVVLDWFEGFRQWMRQTGYEPKQETSSMYDMEAYYGIPVSDIQKLIADFNFSGEFGLLHAIDGALEGLQTLKLRFPNANYKALTSCGTNPWTVLNRARNLLGYGFNELITLPLRASKQEYLAKEPQPTVVIEDHAGHAGVAVACGHISILLEQPWNIGEVVPAGVLRAPNWQSIPETVEAALWNRKVAA